MSDAMISFLNSGVWLIFLFLIGTGAVWLFLVRTWRLKTQADLKQLRTELRQFQSHHRQLSQALAFHSADDPEPYGSRAASLLEQINDVSQQTSKLERRHVQLYETLTRLLFEPFQRTLGAPAFWALRRDVNVLWADLEEARTALNAATEASLALKRLGWEVAQQARQVRATHHSARRILDKLRKNHVGGPAIETAGQQESEARQAFEQLPRYFFEGDEIAVLEQADKESIAQTYAVLAVHQPVLERLQGQVHAWDKQYAAAVEAVGRVRKQLASVEQGLEDPPEGLSLKPFQEQYDALKVIADNLNATLGRLEAESMPQVAEDAGRVEISARELHDEMANSRKQWEGLMLLLPELGDGLRLLSAQLAELAAFTIHPVSWNQSRVRLSTLNRQAQGIGPKSKLRTPDQVRQDMETSTRLNEQRKELAEWVGQISTQHAELRALIESPEISQGMTWIPSAQKRMTQAALYSPENWPRADGIAELPADLEDLAEGVREAVKIQNEALPEADVAARLEEVRALAEAAQRLNARYENVLQRLEEIQAAEHQAQEELERARTAFNQIVFVVRSNAYLEEIAHAEVARLQTAFQQAGDELGKKQQGSVERKAKAISSLVTRVEQAGNQWLDALTKELNAALESISGFLANLNHIANLEEPAVHEANRLLAAGPSYTPKPSLAQPGGVPLDKVLPELNRRSEFWQKCAAVLGALEDVEGHVYESFEAAQEQRQETLQIFHSLNASIRGRREWPPTTIHIDGERQELEQLEKQWEGLKEKPIKALALVSQLGSLTSKYQALAEKARHAQDGAHQERSKAQQFEAELDDLTQRWRHQMQLHTDNQTACGEIQNLLSELDSGLADLQQQYRQGKKNYDQAMQTLKALHRRARLTQVVFDENHVMDVSGRLIAYRDS